MKTVAIYTRTIDKNGYPFEEDYYVEAYCDLLLAIKKYGAEAYFVSDINTYTGSGSFSRAYTVDSKVPFDNFTKCGPIKADVVFEKGDFSANDILVLNPPEVARITENKSETNRLFKKYQVKTILCSNHDELIDSFRQIDGNMIVVKKPVSHSGTDVYIGVKEDVLKRLNYEFPYIVQEFMDTSGGIEGIAKGMHDFRVYILGGEPIACSVREPKAGEYRANTGQGGKETHLYATSIPEDLIPIVRDIDQIFSSKVRYYSIDFAHTKRGWKLIELNSKPGLDPIKNNPVVKYITDRLAQYLVAIC